MRKKQYNQPRHYDSPHSSTIHSQKHPHTPLKSLLNERNMRKESISPKRQQSTESTYLYQTQENKMQKILNIEMQWNTLKTQMNRSMDNVSPYKSKPSVKYSSTLSTLLSLLLHKNANNDCMMDEIPCEDITGEGIQHVKNFTTNRSVALKRANSIPRKLHPRNNGINMNQRKFNDKLIIKAIETNSSFEHSYQEHYSFSEKKQKMRILFEEFEEDHANEPNISKKCSSLAKKAYDSTSCAYQTNETIDNYYICGTDANLEHKKKAGMNCSSAYFPSNSRLLL